ncbi:Ribose-phosphate pyrophosphokinase, N-terminal domain [Phytophthora cactorum]|nr:Ribose-phosphate pyrophosphokinase, N-terminal domain [Phytophthora cactorum]
MVLRTRPAHFIGRRMFTCELAHNESPSDAERLVSHAQCGGTGGAGALGLLGGGLSSRMELSTALADAGKETVVQGKKGEWYPNTTTKHWHFYKGKMNPSAAKSMKLFKVADTPIADEIASYLGVELNDMEVKNFNDGETSVIVKENVRGKRVYIVSSTTTVDRLMELLLAISAMRRASAKSITAVIPFYGYARMDLMHKGREPIAAADIARMLETMGVDHVVSVDLHSAQIEGFFKPQIPVDNLQAFPVGAVYFSEQSLGDPIVVAPHSAAVNRAVIFRDTLSRTLDEFVPLAFVIRKHQLDEDQPGELVGDVEGKDCIVVDNLVDTGSTLVKTAKVLKANGAKTVSAFAVHARYSAQAMEALQNCKELDKLVTTNTIPVHLNSDEVSPKIVTLSVAPFIAETHHTMMAEDKKPQEELEFISVEPETRTTSTSASTERSTGPRTAASPKASDKEALLTSMRKAVTSAKHPVAAFFHLFFKGLALLLYLFGSIFISNFVFIFVVCILLLAFDFWTVKNVTGRLLVGLRWWNKINEDGTSEWVFESHEDMTEIDPLDSRVFWTGLYGAPALWIMLLIIAVLKFNVEWALIVVVGVALSGANIIGYTRCKKDAKQKMQSLMSQGALGAFSSSAGSSIMSTIGGLALGGGLGGLGNAAPKKPTKSEVVV